MPRRLTTHFVLFFHAVSLFTVGTFVIGMLVQLLTHPVRARSGAELGLLAFSACLVALGAFLILGATIQAWIETLRREAFGSLQPSSSRLWGPVEGLPVWTRRSVRALDGLHVAVLVLPIVSMVFAMAFVTLPLFVSGCLHGSVDGRGILAVQLLVMLPFGAAWLALDLTLRAAATAGVLWRHRSTPVLASLGAVLLLLTVAGPQIYWFAHRRPRLVRPVWRPSPRVALRSQPKRKAA
jgi:hypothetical protein